MLKWIEIEYDEGRAGSERRKLYLWMIMRQWGMKMLQVDPPGAAERCVWAPNSTEIVLNLQWWDYLDASLDKIGTLLVTVSPWLHCKEGCLRFKMLRTESGFQLVKGYVIFFTFCCNASCLVPQSFFVNWQLVSYRALMVLEVKNWPMRGLQIIPRANERPALAFSQCRGVNLNQSCL